MQLTRRRLRRSTCWLALTLTLAACSSGGTDEPSGGSGGSAGSVPSATAGTPATGGAGGSAVGGAGGSTPSPNAGSGGTGDPLEDPDPLADAAAPTLDAGTIPDAAAPTAGPNVDRTNPSLHDHAIEPQDLDPSAEDSLETEYAVLDTGVAPLGKLVIFLGGFTNPPAAWHNHGIELAGFGFHVVLPAYNNRWEDCNGPDCNANNRWEALIGEDVSTDIVASRADSAEGRVVAILQHLIDDDPGGDWGYYLDGDELRYEDIIIAGISHGASSSGLYASRRPFWRAVMHSGGWGNPGDAPMTPLTLWYGFAHTDDPDFDPIADSWDNAGMLGERASIDGQSAPYGDAHKLITSEANRYPHCSVAVHESSPMSGGSYVFEPGWRYLYGVAELPD
jgi:hypothetical protein